MAEPVNISQEDQDLLATLRTRFHDAEEAESDTRSQELDDLKFSHGEQWPVEIANRRKQQNRPCLTINQMPQFIRQVTNEQRQNRPAIRVLPQDDFADTETAKILQGLIRHIEVDSNADVAYDTAFEASVRGGKGYFRVLTEYVDERSFDQCIKIRRIRNRFTVYMDPSSQQPDGSDADWAIIVERMSRDTFESQWPDAEATPMAGWTSNGDGWVESDEVRVAEYFYKSRIKRTIILLDDGTIHEERFLPELNGRKEVTRREAMFHEIHWVKTNGYMVLERSRFPGRYIPIIPVLGDEMDINGKIVNSGIVRHAKDSQRMYNYWASAETEAIALAPRAPWVAAEGQLEGYEHMWARANQDNIPYLYYKPRTVGNELAPPPQRQVFEPAVQAITQARLLSRDDLKATTGIYDASLGARSNEQSGRAIIARQREGDVANYHYPDNLARALRHCGRILVDIIPQIYSTRRVVRILGEDNTPKTVTLNAPFKDDDGIQRMYQPGVGRYDIVVDVGPSFATKRQETVATMLELTKAFPALFQVAGDLLVKNMDWPGAQEIAERLQTLLPPELRPEPGNDPKQQLAQLKAAIPQLQQKLQAMNEYAKQREEEAQELQQKNDQLTTAAQSKAAELTVKQEENMAKQMAERYKLELEGQKLQLETRKLELEEQKVALEVAKAQVEISDIHARMESSTEELGMQRQANEQMAKEHQAKIEEVLQTVGKQIEMINESLEEFAEARQAPKTVSVSRRSDGTMVGSVTTEGYGTRTIEIRPNGNGFQGEMD